MKSQSMATKNSSQCHWNYEYFAHKTVLSIFKVMGLAPFSSVQRREEQKATKNINEALTFINFVHSYIGNAYNIFLIIAVVGVNFFSLPLVYKNDYPYKTRLTVTIEMSQAIFGNVIVVFIWLLTCAKQKIIVKFLNRLMNIDVTIVAMTKSIRNYVIILFATNTLVWIEVIVSNQQCYDSELISWMNDIVPGIVVNWFIIQYAITVKLIEKRFDALNRALLDGPRSSIVRSFQSSVVDGVPMDHFDFLQISYLRCAHTELYKIACEATEFYSLPMVLMVAISCYSLIYNAYYLMMPFVLETDDDPTLMIVNSLFWVTAIMLPIVMLALGIDRTTAQMRMVAHTVHKLLARSTISREDRSRLKAFSLEILHRELQFTAYGFFPLDCTLVHSIFSMVITYLIILFQIQMASFRDHAAYVNVPNVTTATEQPS